MSNTDPKKLLAAGLHLGHKKNKVHPKSEQYIHSYQRGTSIIDLIQTAELLDEAKKVLEEARKEGKTLLVVATKKVARTPVSSLCKALDIPYMTNKWVGGFLTNFEEISKNIKKMNDMRVAQADGSWNSVLKHERIRLEKKMNKITSVYGGVEKLEKIPDLLFIIDIKKEDNAKTEAEQLGIPTIGVVDTNVNPEGITYPIPANDDAISSIEFLIEEILKAFTGKTAPKEEATKAPAKKGTVKVDLVEKEEKAPEKAKEEKEEKEKAVDKKAPAKTPKKSTESKKAPAKKKAVKKAVTKKSTK